MSYLLRENRLMACWLAVINLSSFDMHVRMVLLCNWGIMFIRFVLGTVEGYLCFAKMCKWVVSE